MADEHDEGCDGRQKWLYGTIEEINGKWYGGRHVCTCEAKLLHLIINDTSAPITITINAHR